MVDQIEYVAMLRDFHRPILTISFTAVPAIDFLTNLLPRKSAWVSGEALPLLAGVSDSRPSCRALTTLSIAASRPRGQRGIINRKSNHRDAFDRRKCFP